MTRLQAEHQRLYALAADPHAPVGGLTRSMLFELGRPAEWAALSAVWQGVQADLGLPAPAIAVSGSDSLQLWFSLREPTPIAQAVAFLDGLRERYLPQMAEHRLTLIADGPPALPREVAAGRWSALVAPDLAPLFEDTPWLDIAPGEEGQAQLLSGLSSMPAAAFMAALRTLTAGTMPRGADAAALRPHREAPGSPPAPVSGALTPRDFLLSVMQDPTAPLRWRIEAAKALLGTPR